MASSMEIRPSTIIKLGGSLLGVPDLAGRLASFLGDFSRPRPILLCGGGEAVDLLRRWDRIYDIGDEPSHWIALRLLSVNSRIVARILPRHVVLVDSPEDCPLAWERQRVPLYDPFHFIADVDTDSLSPLPRRWRVTGDSIAARMATTFGAEELVLLKSVTLPARLSYVEAAKREHVDPHFPAAARGIPRVVSVNLREVDPRESVLHDSEEPGDP